MGDKPLGVLRQGFAANSNNAGLDVGDNVFAQASPTIRVSGSNPLLSTYRAQRQLTSVTPLGVRQPLDIGRELFRILFRKGFVNL